MTDEQVEKICQAIRSTKSDSGFWFFIGCIWIFNGIMCSGGIG